MADWQMQLLVSNNVRPTLPAILCLNSHEMDTYMVKADRPQWKVSPNESLNQSGTNNVEGLSQRIMLNITLRLRRFHIMHLLALLGGLGHNFVCIVYHRCKSIVHALLLWSGQNCGFVQGSKTAKLELGASVF